MKQLPFKHVVLAAAAFCGVTTIALAQDTKEKTVKKEKQQIVITRSGDKNEKTVIEIDGDNVKVNGKNVADLKDVQVRLNNIQMPDMNFSFGQNGYGNVWNNEVRASLYSVDSNRAMLGVNTERADLGVKLSSVNKGSAAEKAGLQKGDVITKIDSRNIQETGDITDAIRAHKPGDKVSVTYLREGKEQKASAQLDRWKGIDMASMPTAQDWNTAAWGNQNHDRVVAGSRLSGTGSRAQAFTVFGTPRPRLGMSVQDTDDGKGVKVLDTDDDGNAAKAGVKENDIILQIDDKAVNSADELATQMKEKKDQPSVKFQVQRDGKTQTIEVRIPKKLKTVDL